MFVCSIEQYLNISKKIFLKSHKLNPCPDSTETIIEIKLYKFRLDCKYIDSTQRSLLFALGFFCCVGFSFGFLFGFGFWALFVFSFFLLFVVLLVVLFAFVVFVAFVLNAQIILQTVREDIISQNSSDFEVRIKFFSLFQVLFWGFNFKRLRGLQIFEESEERFCFNSFGNNTLLTSLFVLLFLLNLFDS